MQLTLSSNHRPAPPGDMPGLTTTYNALRSYHPPALLLIKSKRLPCRHAMAQLVEALRYKPVRRGFDSREYYSSSRTIAGNIAGGVKVASAQG